MREQFQLVSEAGTGTFYIVTINKTRTPDKLVRKKYDPKVGKHVNFVQKKLPSPKKN
ncbi:MAG: 50S ribosomal protein L33 [Deltaproteobacteria bacterium]|nr:50S ribosomal protein L33 [Deltaproteobacteria bacterium]